MTPLCLLAIVAYFLILVEYIAMRHRVICAESDARMGVDLYWHSENPFSAMKLYWNRGTK